MWGGWLAVTSVWALITIALVAEQVTCELIWSWGNVFILSYMFLAIFILFSLWPIIRYQRGFTPKQSDAANDVDDPSTEQAHIDADRRKLRDDLGTVLFSFVESVLLELAFIFLAIELNNQKNGSTPSVGTTIGFFIAALVIATLVFAYVFARNLWNNSRTESFSVLFACCHTPAYDLDKKKRENAPAWFGDYPLKSWATPLYNISLILGAILLIVSLSIAISFFNNSRPANELASVLWPVWVAVAILIVTTIILIVATFIEGSTLCYDVFILGFSLVLYGGILWTSIWLLHSATLPPHIIVTPLYVVLGISIVVFTVSQMWRCQSSYHIVNTHEDHSTLTRNHVVLDNVKMLPNHTGTSGTGLVNVEWLPGD